MAEVYIDSLTLKNFGPYYGEHVFNFGTLDDRMGILVGGKNGAGKTHLLRALYLAAVGETGVIDLKKVEPASESTRFNFDRSLNRRAEMEGEDTIVLQVTVSQRDEKGVGTRKATFVREIRFRPNSAPVWRSHADREDGSPELDDDKHIEKLRDALLPRHLARFFFFDAERGQNFNLGQQDIVEGISRILGLYAYGELESDLRNLINSKIPRVFNASEGHEAAKKLAELTGRIVTAEGQLTALRDELVTVDLELNEAQTELNDVEERLKSLGAVDPAELQQAQDSRAVLAETKARLDASLTKVWELSLPVGLLGNYRRELHDKLVREEKRREWESSRATVEPKIPQIKEDVFGNPPSEYRLENPTFSFYTDRLDRALHSLFHPPPEGMASAVYITDRNDRSAQIRARLMSGLAPLVEVADLCRQVETVNSTLREIDTKLRQLRQDAAAMAVGAELHRRRGELSTQIEHLQKRKGDRNIEVDSLDVQLKELKREETNQTALANKAKKGQTLVSLAARYREAAGEIRNRAAEQLRRNISEHVGELWVEITERSREFLGMEFDKNWNCFLLRRDNKKVTWEDSNTSAGQRQVRMLAFYEALRRLAKLVPPLVVDTPLGRLDREVKNSVLDQLYLTGHQTIILTTNSEIDPSSSMFDRVKDKLARVYTLHPRGEEESVNYEVTVTNDYFGRPLT
ncbi:MAG: sulfur modification protein DndD [Verrucomicrobiota bacterium]|jgi:DNA sulfur modification protein DndD